MPAKGVEHLNFERNSILEGCGLCQADRMGRLGSQSACQAKSCALLYLSFLHCSSDFTEHATREGPLTHTPFFILESPWAGPTNNLFCTLAWQHHNAWKTVILSHSEVLQSLRDMLRSCWPPDLPAAAIFPRPRMLENCPQTINGSPSLSSFYPSTDHINPLTSV